MIIEFNIGNYRSIKDVKTFNMTAANTVSKYKELDDNNVIKVSNKLTLLKSKGIYGANASGKSNLVRGLVSFISMLTVLSFSLYSFTSPLMKAKMSSSFAISPCNFRLSKLSSSK